MVLLRAIARPAMPPLKEMQQKETVLTETNAPMEVIYVQLITEYASTLIQLRVDISVLAKTALNM